MIDVLLKIINKIPEPDGLKVETPKIRDMGVTGGMKRWEARKDDNQTKGKKHMTLGKFPIDV